MKRKKIVLLVIPLAALAVLVYVIWGIRTPEVTAPVNLATNAGFETFDSSGKPNAWEEDPKGGWSPDAENPYQGERSMRASVTWGFLSQEVGATAGRYYVLKAYARSDITIPDQEDYYNAFLTLECLDWKNKVIQKAWGIVNATSSWELRENTVLVPPGTRKIRAMLAKRQGEGSVWFDEIELMEVPPGSVLNSGFEMISEERPRLWEEDPKGGWSSDAENPYQEERSMRASVTWSWLSQEIPVKREAYYALKAYVRSDIVIPEKEDYYNAFLTLECLDRENEVIHKEWGIVNATSSWQLAENVILVPSDARKMRIMLAKRQGEGSVWFDEVRLVEMPPSLVVNPGFEMLDPSGKPLVWSMDRIGGWSVSTQAPHGGERSMKATINWSFLSQDVPVKDKTYYTLRAQVRSDIAIPDKEDFYNTFLTLECLDEENEIVKRQWGVVNATFLWQVKENLIYTPPETRKIRIRLAKRQGGGSVWFDDLEMIRHRYPPHLWGDKPFWIFYFSLYAILVLSLLRLIFKKRAAPARKE